MKGTTHLTFGIGLGLVLGNVFEAPYNICASTMLGVSLGSLFPDIDSKGLIAHPGKLFSIRNKNTRQMLNSFGEGISSLISSFTAHRGFFHWPINSLIFIIIGTYINSPFSYYFGVGYLSHCFLDSLNKQGIPMFAPFNLKKYHLANIKYGGFIETIFLFLFAMLIIYLIKDDLIGYLNAIIDTKH